MSKAIYDIINDLPTGGPTVMALKSLDAFVPGGWDNITNFEQMIRTVTGETDEGVIQQIGVSITTNRKAISELFGSTTPSIVLLAHLQQPLWLIK